MISQTKSSLSDLCVNIIAELHCMKFMLMLESFAVSKLYDVHL